jgi:hypothetical protein
MSTLVNNAIAWSRRGWTTLTRRRISAQSAYSWSVVQPTAVGFVEGTWTEGNPMPEGTDVQYNVFWFLADVPCSLALLVNGLQVPGISLSEISALLFGVDCTNAQSAPVGTQFTMQHAAAGAVLGYPSTFIVPDFFQRDGVGESNSNVWTQAIANSGVIQGPPFGLSTDANAGWAPVLVPVSAYTEAIKNNNNLIDTPFGTYQVVGLYRLTFTPPVPPPAP